MNRVISDKRKKFNRSLIIATVLSIVLFASISTTIAFLVVGTDSIVNVFTPTKVATEFSWSSVPPDAEEADHPGTSTLKVKNTGDIAIYVRAAVVVNWVKTDADGTRHIHAETPEAGVDYTIKFNKTTWIEHTYNNTEVIYYFMYPVLAENDPTTDKNDKYTNNLFSQFKILDTEPPEPGYEVDIEIVASGIQSTPTSVVIEEWDVVLDSSGNIVDIGGGN